MTRITYAGHDRVKNVYHMTSYRLLLATQEQVSEGGGEPPPPPPAGTKDVLSARRVRGDSEECMWRGPSSCQAEI
jgi:hypothetical protein